MTPLRPDDEREPAPLLVPDEVVATHPILCTCAPCAAYPLPLRRKLKAAHRRQMVSSCSTRIVSS